MAQGQLPNPQRDDGQGRRQASREARRVQEAARYLGNPPEAGRWVLHQQRQGGKQNAELILPPGVRRDAGIEAFIRRYHTDPEFHAKIFEAVETGLAKERDRVLLDAQGKVYLIETEDGLPATTAANMLEEIRKIRTWEEIEQEALNERERLDAEERELICIWCGKVCESTDALADHEEECA